MSKTTDHPTLRRLRNAAVIITVILALMLIATGSIDVRGATGLTGPAGATGAQGDAGKLVRPVRMVKPATPATKALLEQLAMMESQGPRGRSD